ncbi:MAG: 3-hydroxybutyryl-CoA dehydrogenase [Bdellovibrionales bacterium]|nr:3-hydroxybutyryl-CoA dehydrogenase [Bdellovibrionales bacterium]
MIKQIGVVGAGQMGQGIAQTAAQSGFSVMVADQSLDAAAKGIQKIKVQLDKLIGKQKVTTDAATGIMRNLKPVGALAEFKDCDLVIEAVSENMNLKRSIFQELDKHVKPSGLFASNTSSISITELAAATKRPTQFAGMHFMNPVPIMKLVEGISGIQTSKETFSVIKETAEKMGKTFVSVRDMPGFAVNRILMPMINEAVYALYEGIASVEDIDASMTLGTNQPMGPLTLADFIGLDTCLAIMEVLHGGLGDSKYRPCPLLKQYVTAGWLGKKSGRGFYTYNT